jgi:hypothetical protein
MWLTTLQERKSLQFNNPNAVLVRGSYGKDEKNQTLENIDGQTKKKRVEFVVSDELEQVQQVWSGVNFNLYRKG